MEHKNKNPNVDAKGFNDSNQRLNSTRKRFSRQFNRALLPTPADYYSKQFPKFKIKSEWVNVNCCFHSPDSEPSLSLNMVDGHFKCHACDAKGGNVLDFHLLRYKVCFVEAINFFGAWSYE